MSLPVEAYELWHQRGAVKAVTPLMNVGGVANRVWTLRRRG